MIELSMVFLIFIIYSFIGWCMEIVVTFPETRKIVNRGFMIGPVCPIYGYGCWVLILWLSKYKSDPLLIMMMATSVCTIIEYITSYLMEKIFKARWWDYSHRKFNVNGRVCLFNAVGFGVLGYVVVVVTTPLFVKLFRMMNPTLLMTISFILTAIYFVDFVISYVIIFKFKTTTFEMKKDNTEEITEKVRMKFLNGNYFTRRLMQAFPNVRETLKLKKEQIEKKANAFQDNIIARFNIMKKFVYSKVNPHEYTIKDFTKTVMANKKYATKILTTKKFKDKKFRKRFIAKLKGRSGRFKTKKAEEKNIKS